MVCSQKHRRERDTHTRTHTHTHTHTYAHNRDAIEGGVYCAHTDTRALKGGIQINTKVSLGGHTPHKV